ncbi:MAG: site-specific tyrosine recombinase XerD [Candidatus Zixiibacteriota bacterium]
MEKVFKVFFDDFLQYLKLERGLAVNSIKAYASDLNEFAEQSSCRDPLKVTALNINEYFSSLNWKGQRPSTLARKISSLKRFFGYLKDNGQIKENPALAYSAPKIARYHPDYLSPEEIKRIIETIKPEDNDSTRNRAVIELLYGSGLRLSELINLKIADIEFEAGFLRILGKGNKQRLVPLGDFAGKAVTDYLITRKESGSGAESEFVFLNRYGKIFSRVGLWKIIKKLVMQAGIVKKVTPHTFRHSFATHLIEGGADLRMVQEMLGHADISTTEIYTKIDRDYIIAEHKKYHPRELGRNPKSR